VYAGRNGGVGHRRIITRAGGWFSSGPEAYTKYRSWGG
jgi:hypothetical protein